MNHEDAEDVVQEAFTKIYVNAASFNRKKEVLRLLGIQDSLTPASLSIKKGKKLQERGSILKTRFFTIFRARQKKARRRSWEISLLRFYQVCRKTYPECFISISLWAIRNKRSPTWKGDPRRGKDKGVPRETRTEKDLRDPERRVKIIFNLQFYNFQINFQYFNEKFSNMDVVMFENCFLKIH